MKKIALYLALIVAVGFSGRGGHRGEDVGNIQPVQLLMAQWTEGKLQLTTDTGHCGTGANVEKAIQDMNESAAGKIFLDTADYLLIRNNTLFVLEELSGYLRPSCSICQVTGQVDLSEAAQYLQYHVPWVTLAMYEAGEREVPQLISEEGSMKLER